MAKLTILDAAVYCGTYKKYNGGSLDGGWLHLGRYQDGAAFLEACKKFITQTAVQYICNIYTQAGCTPIQETPLKLREVWNNYQASREEYANGNCLHEKSK